MPCKTRLDQTLQRKNTSIQNLSKWQWAPLKMHDVSIHLNEKKALTGWWEALAFISDAHQKKRRWWNCIRCPYANFATQPLLRAMSMELLSSELSASDDVDASMTFDAGCSRMPRYEDVKTGIINTTAKWDHKLTSAWGNQSFWGNRVYKTAWKRPTSL